MQIIKYTVDAIDKMMMMMMMMKEHSFEWNKRFASQATNEWRVLSFFLVFVLEKKGLHSLLSSKIGRSFAGFLLSWDTLAQKKFIVGGRRTK
jgi:hypothetical protein